VFSKYLMLAANVTKEMPQSGMVVILFRSRLTEQAGEDYHSMAAEMLATAREMPGFVEYKVFRADDGERISVIWWQDQETLAAWRNHPRHRIAQKAGRERWYEYYNIEVAEVVRNGLFERRAGR
jgi:heme-degrading monooxygenase HmoA